MTKPVHQEEYHGHTINIFQDEDAQAPNEWGDDGLFLVNFHRDFHIERKTVITQDDVRAWYQGESIEQAKTYHIFRLSMLSHSGVWLSLQESFVGDGQGWDTSHVGAVLVSKAEWKARAKAEKAAESLVNEWNDYLSGNVYSYRIDEDGDSCWGFYGDIEAPGGILAEARASVDHTVAEEHKARTKQVKAYIRHRVPLDKRTAASIS